MAIRSCFVDTLSGFNAPSVFHTSDSVSTTSPSLVRVPSSRVPRCQRYYETLRLPVQNACPLMVSLAGSNACSVVCSRSAEAAGEPGRVASSDRSDTYVGSYTGSLRFLGNPSNASAMRSDPDRSSTTSPWQPHQCCPHSQPHEGTSDHMISGRNTTALTPAAYASRSTLPHPMQGSLPAGG